MWVDVVTAVHAQYAVYLPAAWDSLRRQRHPHWTWRVQIDGPPGEVIDALTGCGAAGDGRVRIAAHGTLEGPAVARNIALGECTAPLVQNLDADDELEPDALAALSGALTAHPAVGYAVGHARDLHADGTLHTAPLAVPAGPLARGALAVAWASALPDHTLPPVHPAGVMWRRNLLLAVGGWAALRGVEDTATLIAGSALATGILLDVPTLRYRRHDAQRSRQNGNFSGGGGSIFAYLAARLTACRRTSLERIKTADGARWHDQPTRHWDRQDRRPVRNVESTSRRRPASSRIGAPAAARCGTGGQPSTRRANSAASWSR